MPEKKTIERKAGGNARGQLLLWCAAAFAMSAAVTLIAATVKGLFPFGEQSIYFSDLSSEYSVYLMELWHKVHAGGSLIYSWKTALGGSFLGNILYYTSSPLNLIVLLVRESMIDESMAVLIYLRQALSAVFMCVFLSRRRGGRASFAGALCGFLYATCGWFCGYYYCTIWLDVFMLMPLLLLGIERIIDFRKPALYFTVFVLMLFSNFYTSYFAAVFAVAYWLYYYFANYRFTEPAEAGGTAKRVGFFRSRFFSAGTVFAVFSVLAVLCLAVFFIPLLLQMSRNEANLDATSKASYFTNLTQQFSAMFSGADFRTNTFQRYPAIYTGVLSLAAVPLYFFLKSVPMRKKLAGAVLLLFLVLSFNLPLLDYFWHGMRYPTNYPFREAMYLSVVLILFLHRVITDLKELPPKAFFTLLGGSAVIAGSAAVELIVRDERQIAISIVDVIITAVLFLVFAGGLVMCRFGKREQTAAALVFLFVFSFIDGAYTFTSNIRLEQWTQADLDTEGAHMRKLLDKTDDDSLFSRTELAVSWMFNDGAFFDFYGVRQQSSMTPTSTLKLLNSFGCDSNLSNFVDYRMQTPLMNSVFGVKYLVENDDYADHVFASYLSCVGESYRVAETIDGYSLYRFGNALSLGFAADRSLIGWVPQEFAAVDNQSSFYAAAAGSDESALVYCDDQVTVSPVSDQVEAVEAGEHRYHVANVAENGTDAPGVALEVNAKTAGMLYVYAEVVGDDFSNLVLHVANTKAEEYVSFNSLSSSFCSAVYFAEKNEPLKISVYPGEKIPCTILVRVFQVDDAVFARQHETIANGGRLVLTEFADTHFEGTVDMAEDGRVLCVTVPYDPGWQLTVDGKTLTEDDYTLIGGALYGIPMEKGSHNVSFSYHLPGLKGGTAVTLVSVVATAVLFVLLYRKKRPKNEPTENAL